MHKVKIAAVLTGLALVAGCATTPRLAPAPGLTIMDAQALPSPNRQDLLAPDRETLIGPLDQVNIKVFGVESLDTETQVDSSGRISLPVAGVIDVRGMTAQELSAIVTQRLRTYVRNPMVTINVQNASQVVTVDGEVEKPGLYPVTNQTTLMRAIASAEGISEFGKIDDVVVLRTVDGQRMAGLYNIGAIRRGVYPDPAIYANDVVVVGDSPARRRFKDIIALAPLLSAPLFAVLP